MLKLEELIKDKWYYLETAYKWIVKFEKIKDNLIIGTRYYNISKNYHYNNPINICANIREASKEEVLKYFPDEKFDDKIELIYEEIYTCKFDNSDYIFKHSSNGSNIKHLSIKNSTYSGYGWQFYLDKGQSSNIKLATSEKKQWLEACIEANKFISKEEALEHPEEIPEYVELIDGGCRINNECNINRIYKLCKSQKNNYYYNYKLDDIYEIGLYRYDFKKYLKPSTKEAFDLQNKPKSLVGRYIKIIKSGYFNKVAGVWDYLKILNDKIDNCYTLDKYGLCALDLSVTNGVYHELMPEGFIPSTESKFEVGKWYKANDWIIKYEKHHESNTCIWGDCIKTTSGFRCHGTLDLSYTFILTDLTEIQQYLPDGHPDKYGGIKLYSGGSKEEFKVIPDTNSKYEISCNGLIRNSETKAIISQSLSSKGYYKVNLWLNNKNVSRVVHRLLAQTYISNPSNHETVDHIDGNKLNNSISNLRWCTSTENSLYYKESGGKWNSNLSDDDIKDIYLNYNKYGEQKEAAEKYNVSKGTISLIKSGTSFSHITSTLKALPHEIPVEIKTASEMNITKFKDELLAEAKRRYPVGTIFKSALDNTTTQISSGYFVWIEDSIDCCGRFVYNEGRWAEIVSKPEPNELTSLPEKWCIKASNQKEAEVIAEYANPLNLAYSGNSWISSDSLKYYLLIENGKYRIGNIDPSENYPDYVKITFDQFKRWVLKDSISLVDRMKPLQEEYDRTQFQVLSKAYSKHLLIKEDETIKIELSKRTKLARKPLTIK